MRSISVGLLISLLAITATAAELTGSIVRVHDGDTLTIQTASRRVTVRLEGIDAPELKQPYGPESRDALRALCPDRIQAVVDVTGQDRYGRTLGRVRCGQGPEVNAAQVTAGWAWAFLRYVRTDSPLIPAEATARTDYRGLWKASNPESPWDYRARKRE